jgi:AraC family transcriptional regulator
MSSWASRSGSALRRKIAPDSNVQAPENGKGGTGDRPGPVGLPQTAAGTSQEHRVRKILKLIETEPACRIPELAAQCKLSHSHLQHLFKRQTGVRLGHLILEQRLLKAAQLLENSNMSVKEIAYAVGYEHTSSFTRAFERRFGQAPRSYRRQSERRKS